MKMCETKQRYCAVTLMLVVNARSRLLTVIRLTASNFSQPISFLREAYTEILVILGFFM